MYQKFMISFKKIKFTVLYAEIERYPLTPVASKDGKKRSVTKQYLVTDSIHLSGRLYLYEAHNINICQKNGDIWNSKFCFECM